MDFTYDSYKKLLNILNENGYRFSSYYDYPKDKKCVILRHDIDYSLEQAVRLAEIEAEHDIKSTFFVLLSSDFYNPASASSYKTLHKLVDLGHNIGLHFDETAYDYDRFDIEYYIRKETRILSDLLDINVNAFSLHRPNKMTIETKLNIPGLLNSYGEEFFHGFKYLSDSRRRWREPVEEIITSNEYTRLHVLTHAFWYHKEEQTINTTIRDFIALSKRDRTACLRENITGLDDILGESCE